MSTCATCKHWKFIGASPSPQRLVRDMGVTIVPPGDRGECRAHPPPTDHTWPVTYHAEACSHWAEKLDAGRTAAPATPVAAAPSTAEAARPASSIETRDDLFPSTRRGKKGAP